MTFAEFQAKISIKDVVKQSEKYVISENYFTEQFLSCFYQMRSQMQAKAQSEIQKFDANGDHKFDFAEYDKMCRTLEPTIQKTFILRSYKDAFGQGDDGEQDTLSISKITDFFLKYQIGGHGRHLMCDYLLKEH